MWDSHQPGVYTLTFLRGNRSSRCGWTVQDPITPTVTVSLGGGRVNRWVWGSCQDWLLSSGQPCYLRVGSGPLDWEQLYCSDLKTTRKTDIFTGQVVFPSGTSGVSLLSVNLSCSEFCSRADSALLSPAATGKEEVTWKPQGFILFQYVSVIQLVNSASHL